jgi:hypothetical protein
MQTASLISLPKNVIAVTGYTNCFIFLLSKKENQMAQISPRSAMDTLANAVQNRSPHSEGNLTKQIENQTAKIPSVGFLGLAIGSMVASAALAFFSERKEYANFVGLWAPSFLLIGIYNKLVKLQGSDMQETSHGRV